MRRGSKTQVLYAGQTILAMPEVQVQVDTDMHVDSVAAILVVGLDTEIMPTAVHGVGNNGR